MLVVSTKLPRGSERFTNSEEYCIPKCIPDSKFVPFKMSPGLCCQLWADPTRWYWEYLNVSEGKNLKACYTPHCAQGKPEHVMIPKVLQSQYSYPKHLKVVTCLIWKETSRINIQLPFSYIWYTFYHKRKCVSPLFPHWNSGKSIFSWTFPTLCLLFFRAEVMKS